MIHMRIAFFTDTYEPQKNGVVTSINLFAESLRKKGHTHGQRPDKLHQASFTAI